MMDGKMDQDVREAAAFHYLEMLPFATSRGARLIRDGQADSLPFVQTFARMKEAGRQAGLKEAAEVAAKCKRQAKCPNDPFLQGAIDVVYDDMIDTITAFIERET